MLKVKGFIMIEKIGRYEFIAEPFHCDFDNRLFMGHLGNHLINAADFHSNDRGFGMLYLNTIHKTWVLSRLALEIAEMPKAYDRFFVETWVESVMRSFTCRNFKIVGSEASGEERVYGYGRSVWAMIDTTTRQPIDLLSVNNGALGNYVEDAKVCPIGKPSRVKMGADSVLRRSVETVYSDIDMNRHVNSIKYIEHVLDLWDTDWYAAHKLQRLDIAFVAEAHLGDHLLLYVEEKGSGNYAVRVVAATPDKERDSENNWQNEVEVCRCQVVFSM